MSGTIVDITIPSEQFALEYTLNTLETATFEVEQMVATNHKVLMPLVWIDSPDRISLEATLADDDSVADFQLVANFETDCLYQLEWAEHVEHLIHVLVERNGTVLRAIGHDDSWNLRMLFADREMAAQTNEYCLEHDIDFDVADIHAFTGHSGSRAGLTSCQQTALQLAAERGYYTVPREASAEDLAQEFGISHQALSERLRRAHGNLIQQVFGIRNEKPDPADSLPAESHSETSVD